MLLPSQKDIDRFWSKVDKTTDPDGCWLWTKCLNKDGYGIFAYINTLGKARNIRAHRFAYLLEHGDIPAGLFVLHIPPCLNKHCVRHTYAGNARDNAADTRLLGRLPTGHRNGAHTHPEHRARGKRQGAHTHPERHPRGERHGSSKLTATAIYAIREQHAAGIPQRLLAHQHGVSCTTLNKIVLGKIWRHLL